MHYAAPQYAVIEEVRNATGRTSRRAGERTRYADMVAMGLWPSIGLDLTGFEIKFTRADWLSEISDEKKAVAVKQYCDFWCLVTGSEKIVKEGELPDGWGWLVVNGSKIKEMVAPQRLNPPPVSKLFLASLMRNATTSNPDYIEVQSRIIEQSMAEVPQSRSRSGIKKAKRQTLSSMSAEVKHLKKVIADMKAAGFIDSTPAELIAA